MEKDKELQESKPTNTRLKMTIGILFLVVLSIVELYLMMNYSDNYLFLGLVGLAILCFVYWVTDLTFRIHREQESSLEKDFENLYKAQKVSYVTVKQGFTKFEELLDDLGEELAFPVDEILQAQKAVGRVTIQKSKENIDAVVESNEKLIGQLQSFEQKFAEIEERIDAVSAMMSVPLPEAGSDRQEEIVNTLARMEGMLQEGRGSVMTPPGGQEQILDALTEIEDMMRREFGREPVKDRQQEILDYLARIEASVRDEISELEVHMESKIDEIPSAVQEEQKMSPEELEKILGETSALMEEVHLDIPVEGEMSNEKGELDISELIGEFDSQDDVLTSAGSGGPENFVMMDGATAAEETQEPKNFAMPDGATAAEETQEPKNFAMPDGATAAEEMQESENFAMPDGATAAEEMQEPENFAMPDDAMAVEEIQEPENLAMPELAGMPGDVMPEEEVAEPENLVMPEATAEAEAFGELENLIMPDDRMAAEAYGESENLAMPNNRMTAEEIDKSSTFGDETKSPDIAEIPEEFVGSEKVMTPEEIAALLGESGEMEENSESEEETPPMPDLSDPGHVMTPEEIAALLANM